MIKWKSKIGAMLLSAVMLGTITTIPVQAASSVTGNISGATCSGSVSFVYAPGGACNGVQAKTIYGNGGILKVKAKVFYKAGGELHTKEVSNSSSGGGVSAIARNNDTGNVYGGTGWHYVKAGAYSWERDTSIGTTW